MNNTKLKSIIYLCRFFVLVYEQFVGLLEQYKLESVIEKIERRDLVARSMAIQSAIRQGKVLDKKEMTMLIDQLFACEQPNFAPNGDKTFITLTLEELSKGFFK